MLPEVDAGVVVVPKPGKPAEAAEDTLAAAGAEALVVVVVVTVENREEGVVPNVLSFEVGALERDDAEADD